MKTAGIVGGIGPESTIEYYRLVIASYRERVRDGSYPRLLINSIDLKTMIDLFEARRLSEVTEYLLAAVAALARAGADFAVGAANTPHVVFTAVSERSPIPLISIVDVTCRAASTLGLRRLGLFGTRFTMEAGFYQDAFRKAALAVVLPTSAEQAYIHEKYMGELVQGVVLPETRAGLLAIVERLKRDEKIDGVILGGTELPLILRDAAEAGIPFLDTTTIHAEAVVAALLS